MKTALILEGGAMRGMYTAGVLDIFLDNGISIDYIVGVSAGALFGVNFASGQRGRTVRYNKQFNSDKNYIGLRPLIREGNIINTKYAYDDVPHKLDPFDDEAYKKSDIEYYAVVTDMAGGKPEYIKIESVFEQMDVLRASASMPFVSKPVKLGDKLYLDGGVSDSIPFEWGAKLGCDRLIVVLTRDISYRKKPMSKLAVRMSYRKYPKFKEQLKNRHLMYNTSVEKLAEWEKQGRAFVIRPSAPIDIKRIEKDPQKLQQVYELGLNDGADCMPSLRQYLS